MCVLSRVVCFVHAIGVLSDSDPCVVLRALYVQDGAYRFELTDWLTDMLLTNYHCHARLGRSND